ncbi:MAG TPA: helix-turn-helix domain-containing protein [Methanomassiliicoccales archaeon]|nr:helix-turn-helix domain-containing protein [Methanomassiliicoccales archaeon]HNX47328.1 helix-turn-helix domain-containing protein [Methanomassiliicoccales archaeon]HPR98596.1 helix-turn-helix domain-containing protein [Methanomassiliicoccales archaeon]
MIEAVLEVDIPDSWVHDISANFNVPVRILDCIHFGEHGARSFVELECNDPEMQQIVSRAIEKHPDVCKWEPAIAEDGRMRGIALLTKCRACKAVMRSDCYLRSAKTIGNGKVEWQIIASREAALGALIDELKKNGCAITLRSKKTLDDTSFVTKRQEVVVHAALMNGYYDYPRGVSLQQLAKSFDVTTSTMGEILQRGERNIIREYFRTKM